MHSRPSSERRVASGVGVCIEGSFQHSWGLHHMLDSTLLSMKLSKVCCKGQSCGMNSLILGEIIKISSTNFHTTVLIFKAFVNIMTVYPVSH